MLDSEKKFGVKKFETYKQFANKIYKLRENFQRNLKRLQKQKKLIAYGAPRKANCFKFFFGKRSNKIYN